ncbi:putative Acyl-CoA dehydrogenase family member 9, mitochondrial [Glarea lozoyensis 74030]|nr:putative Acyl-CoA dehydrogenase family member 9, mitochondrial [Glarea lozoyensis 74030]
MGRVIEPAMAFLEQLTWLIEENRRGGGVRIGGMTAMLKVVSTRCLEFCVREAQQVMGGVGYSRGGRGGRVEAISRDVRVMAVGGGSEEIMDQLAIREETKDLKKYNAARSKL